MKRKANLFFPESFTLFPGLGDTEKYIAQFKKLLLAEILSFALPGREKLPIIYANIRV